MIVCAMIALLGIGAFAQAPRNTQRVVLVTEYPSCKDALDALIIDLLPDMNLTPCWIDSEYGLVKTEDEEATSTTARMSYFFQIREEDGLICIEVTGKYLSYLSDKYFKRIQMGGMRGSLQERTFREMEQTALYIPHLEVLYR